MSPPTTESRPVSRLTRPALLASAFVLTVGVTVLLAHEGHAPLPTRGVVVNIAKGTLLLTAAARASIDVDTAAVEPAVVEEKLLAYASLAAPWQNHGYATAGLAGRVVRVRVAPGQSVKAGDILAEVESLELDTLQLDLLTARNDIRLSEKLAAELTRSVDAGATSGQAAQDARSQLAQNRNVLAVARVKWLGLGLPEASLADLLRRGEPIPGLALPVTTPVSGTVVHAELTAGKVVEPTEHLAEVIDLSTVWVRVGVLEKDLHRVAVGQPVEVSLAAYPGERFRTTVLASSPLLDPVTNVATVWAELVNPPGPEPRFQPGMAGLAYLVVSDGKPRPTVPAESVLREGLERFVLVEEANAAGSSEYRERPVAVGRSAGGRVELIGGGLFPGDRVVTRGAHELGPFFSPGVLKLSPEAERTIGLKVEPSRFVAVDEVVAIEGVVEVPPGGRGFAASQLAGTVRSIRVDHGQAVKAGDVLAEVFSPEFLTLQAEFLRVHLEDALASDTLGRLRAAGAGVSARRLWELESQLNGLKAQADSSRRKLATAGLSGEQIDQVLARREMISAAPVRAPFDGVVVDFDKVLGQAVAAHESLFEVHDAAHPWVQGFVSERDAARVRVGQPVRVRLVADPGFVGTGRVARSGRTLGKDNHVQSIWVEFDSLPTRPLLHNQLARLTVVLGTRPPALAAPRAAIAVEGASSFVFVRKPDGAFERRTVETGPADDQFVTVIQGLAEGESVAVVGTNDLMTAYASLR